MAIVVTLGTGLSCISQVIRSEGNGSDNEDKFDDGRHVRDMQGSLIAHPPATTMANKKLPPYSDYQVSTQVTRRNQEARALRPRR